MSKIELDPKYGICGYPIYTGENVELTGIKVKENLCKMLDEKGIEWEDISCEEYPYYIWVKQYKKRGKK